MRRVLWSAVVAVVLGATVFLTGCSGGLRPAVPSATVSPYVGTWVLSSVAIGGQTFSGPALSQVNITATLNLNADHTASVTAMGTTASGTWKQKNATTLTVTMTLIPQDVTIEGNTLVTTLAGAKVTLVKH